MECFRISCKRLNKRTQVMQCNSVFVMLNPMGFNMTNTLLHCITCVLLFNLLQLILKHSIAAFVAAFLFAIHPIQTEAVTYIASRGDLLASLTMLASMIFYFKCRLF